MSKQPNIILIMADQLAASFIGCYGSGVPSTPNLDAMAAYGCRFTRNYAAAPVCAPNRACILTGRSSIINGICMNNMTLGGENPAYPHVLRRQGYATGGFGKCHVTPMMWPVPENLRYLGFEESVITEDPKWGPYIDWVQEKYPQYLERAIAITNDHSGNRGASVPIETLQGASTEEVEQKKQWFEKYMRPRMEKSPWDRMYPSPLPAEVHDTRYITDLGLDFIHRHAGEDKPFFCHISYVDPHDPYNPPEPYASMFSPEDMKEALPQEWKEEDFPYLAQAQRSYLRFDKIKDRPGVIAKLRALYHGSIKFIDDQIGRIIARVRELGLWENTVILFTTDHGDLMGDHGLIAKGETHYDACVRTPLIAAGGPVQEGIVSQRLTTSLDIYPTLCAWAQCRAEELPPLEGISFAEVCGGAEQDPHEEIGIMLGNSSTVITREGYRLTLNTAERITGQMFFLKDDPQEQHNLYRESAYAEKKQELLERLMRVKNAPAFMPQYAVLPVRDGRAFINDGATCSIPLYPQTRSPWHEDAPKPCWRAEEKRPKGCGRKESDSK